MLGGLRALRHARSSRIRTPDAPRRLRVAFFGTCSARRRSCSWSRGATSSPGDALPFERISVAFTLVVPASFAWAIAVHRVFDFRVALRAIDGGRHRGVLAAVATYGAGEWLARAWWPVLGEGVSGASLAFLALVAALAGPARPLAVRARRARGADRRRDLARRMDALGRGRAQPGTRPPCCARRARWSCARCGSTGCAAARAEDGALRLVSFAGARLSPAPGPDSSRRWGASTARASSRRSNCRTRTATRSRWRGVHWVLPVPGTPARRAAAWAAGLRAPGSTAARRGTSSGSAATSRWRSRTSSCAARPASASRSTASSRKRTTCSCTGCRGARRSTRRSTAPR